MVKLDSILSFDELREQILLQIPEDDGAREQMRTGLQKMYDRPPVKDMEASLQRNLTIDQIRQYLFFPNEEDMDLYPIAISSGPEGAPSDHYQSKTQRCFLSLLYLVHIKKWSLSRRFIHNGGLHVLISLMTDPNLYIKSQAIECFLAITSSEEYDWFDTNNSSEPEARTQMHSLINTPFLRVLLSNFNGGYPGCSFTCLQILAFWLSWIRIHFTRGPEHILQLSKNVLDTLKAWSVKDDEDSSPEERKLAETVYNDFSRYPPLDDQMGENKTSIEAAPAAAVVEKTKPAEAGKKPVVNKAEEKKTKGNQFFAKGQYEKAAEHYTAAIQLDDRIPAYFGNRSICMIKMYQAEKLEGKGDVVSRELYLQCALTDCDKALELDSSFAKAHLRKAQALYELRKFEEAKQHALKAQQAFPQDTSVEVLLLDISDELKKQAPPAAPVSSGSKTSKAKIQVIGGDDEQEAQEAPKKSVAEAIPPKMKVQEVTTKPAASSSSSMYSQQAFAPHKHVADMNDSELSEADKLMAAFATGLNPPSSSSSRGGAGGGGGSIFQSANDFQALADLLEKSAGAPAPSSESSGFGGQSFFGMDPMPYDEPYEAPKSKVVIKGGNRSASAMAASKDEQRSRPDADIFGFGDNSSSKRQLHSHQQQQSEEKKLEPVDPVQVFMQKTKAKEDSSRGKNKGPLIEEL